LIAGSEHEVVLVHSPFGSADSKKLSVDLLRAIKTATSQPQKESQTSMPADLHRFVAQETITVGNPISFESRSPSQPYAVVFEDDGSTGYMYGLDLNNQDDPIVDALLIYDVAEVADRKKPSIMQLVWSRDGLKAGLLIDLKPHAVFDFESKRGYCRTGFPSPNRNWTRHSHAWSRDAEKFFR